MSAEGSQAELSYIKEVSWGVTPVGQFTGVNFVSEDMAENIENKTSNSIRPDRQTTDVVQVSSDVSGGFETEVQAPNLDGLLPAFLMVADWTLNVITNGVARSSFSIQRTNTDVSQYFLYAGMVPNTLEINVESENFLTMNLSFIGGSEVLSQVDSSSPAATALPGTPIMSAGASVGTVKMDGASVAACLLQKVSVLIDNKAAGKSGIGSLSACDVVAKSLSVTGSLSMYFSDSTEYDRYKAGTPFKLEFTMTDSLGNSYAVELPKCKYEKMTANVTGKEDDVMAESTYIAYVGPGGYTIKITRVVI